MPSKSKLYAQVEGALSASIKPPNLSTPDLNSPSIHSPTLSESRNNQMQNSQNNEEIFSLFGNVGFAIYDGPWQKLQPRIIGERETAVRIIPASRMSSWIIHMDDWDGLTGQSVIKIGVSGMSLYHNDGAWTSRRHSQDSFKLILSRGQHIAPRKITGYTPPLRDDRVKMHRYLAANDIERLIIEIMVPAFYDQIRINNEVDENYTRGATAIDNFHRPQDTLE